MQKNKLRWNRLVFVIILVLFLANITPTIVSLKEQNLTIYNSLGGNKTNTDRGSNIILDIEGNDHFPSLTMDNLGNTVITWTNEQDLTSSDMGIAYSDKPTDPSTWVHHLISPPLYIYCSLLRYCIY